jgi:hypothetical protein
MNDADSFDTDRLSGSIQYDDNHQEIPLADNIPPPVIERNPKEEKKLKKKEVKDISSKTKSISFFFTGRK